jgi:hypothetical protein
VESVIPDHAKSKLYTCSETIWNSVLFLANYPFSPSKNTLEYDDFVRACAFLTGRAEVVYRAPHVDESDVWTAQYSRQPQTMISDAILRSISLVDPDIEICLEIPDEDVFELLATLQPIYNENSIPHYKSQLWAFSNKLSGGRIPRASLRVQRKALLNLLLFFQAVLPEYKEIGYILASLSAADNIDSSLSSDSLGIDMLDGNALVSHAACFHTTET